MINENPLMDLELPFFQEETHYFNNCEESFNTSLILDEPTSPTESKIKKQDFEEPPEILRSENFLLRDEEDPNHKGLRPSYPEVLQMELDRDSLVRNTFQEESLRYKHLHSFFFTPSSAIDRRSRLAIEDVLKNESKKQKPKKNEFIIGSDSASGKQNIAIYDPNISVDHAKIVYKDFFSPYFTLMLCQIKTLQANSGKVSLVKKIPSELHRKIMEYVGPKISFFIEDNGSRQGTYELISEAKPKETLDGQEIQISADTQLMVLQTKNTKGCLFDQERDNILRKLIKYDRVMIVGAGEYLKYLEKDMVWFNKNSYKETRNLKWEDDLNLSIPFMKLQVCLNNGMSYRYIILPQDKTSFTVGRNNKDADIPVCSILCSRKHCEIKYDDQRGTWTVNDGHEGKGSLAGTWNSLQTIKERKELKRSKQIPITDGSLFKIGESIFRFSYKKIKYNEFQLINS